jgi:hypothetical protein
MATNKKGYTNSRKSLLTATVANCSVTCALEKRWKRSIFVCFVTLTQEFEENGLRARLGITNGGTANNTPIISLVAPPLLEVQHGEFHVAKRETNVRPPVLGVVHT